MEKVLKICAWLVSVIFHPLGIIPLLCAAEYMILYRDYNEPITCGLLYHVLSAEIIKYYLIPLFLCGIYALIFVKRETIADVKHRMAFLWIVILVIATFVLWSLYKGTFMLEYKAVLLGLFVVYIATIITYFWKISLHMIGLGGLLAYILLLLFVRGLQYGLPSEIDILLSSVILLSGIVGSARLYLCAHTPAQVYVGYIVGFLLVGVYAYIYLGFAL